MEQSYKEKYEQAIERLKQWDREHPCAGYVLSDRDKFIFPELVAESEDEKIRKELLVFCRTLATGRTSVLANNIDFNKWISWLEKQGEQKFEMKTAEESLGIDSDTYNKIVDECILGEQKPVEENKGKIGGISDNPEWSEEDEKILTSILRDVKHGEPLDKLQYDWLKSLKNRVQQQNQWEPSAEQMEAIRIAAEVGTANNSWAMKILKEMYNEIRSFS